jgi:hypothetical protein
MVNFTLEFPYRRYPLHSQPGGRQSRSGLHDGEEENVSATFLTGVLRLLKLSMNENIFL